LAEETPGCGIVLTGVEVIEIGADATNTLGDVFGVAKITERLG
jgi:hypothetical protein